MNIDSDRKLHKGEKRQKGHTSMYARAEIAPLRPFKRKFFEGVRVMKQKTEETASFDNWHPERCENCELLFERKTWESYYSLSGELVWSCPKCSHVNYPQLVGAGK